MRYESTIEADWVTLRLDFTVPDWGEADFIRLKATHRATTSSKTPGQLNRGVVFTPLAQLERCPGCGHIRPVGPGAHAPRINADASGFVDCAGRPVHRGAGGYYELTREAA